MGHAGKACAVVAALATGTLSTSAATPPEKLDPCLACHGAEGRSENAEVPSLGAQPSTYTLIQLFMFRERLRLSEPMNAMANELSDDDLQSMAGAIAALPPPEPLADPGDAARLGQARALIEQNHCNICHRADFSGQENVPRLADQREDYLLKTMRDYKSGARHGYDATMAEVLQPISDAELVDFAYYLSHLH
jgi:cytochrome c553